MGGRAQIPLYTERKTQQGTKADDSKTKSFTFSNKADAKASPLKRSYIPEDERGDRKATNMARRRRSGRSYVSANQMTHDIGPR